VGLSADLSTRNEVNIALTVFGSRLVALGRVDVTSPEFGVEVLGFQVQPSAGDLFQVGDYAAVIDWSARGANERILEIRALASRYVPGVSEVYVKSAIADIDSLHGQIRLGRIVVDQSAAVLLSDNAAGDIDALLAVRGFQPAPQGVVLGNCLSVEAIGTRPEGSLGTGRPEGSLGTGKPEGSLGTGKPEGSLGTGQPEGSLGTGRPEGSLGTGRPEGSLGTGRPEGSLGTGRPEGSLGTGRPEGSLGTGRPEGSLGTGRPEGSLGTGRPEGSLGTGRPEGSLGTGKPEGSLGTGRPEGSLGTGKPEGSLGTGRPNGSLGTGKSA
jgi:hypothetical protein